MRCNTCNKFASYDTEVEPEDNNDAEFDGETFTATVRRVLNCAECGDELKSAEIDIEQTEEPVIELPEEDEEAKAKKSLRELCAECGSQRDGHDDGDEAGHAFEPSGEYDDDDEHEHDWEVELDDLTPEMRTVDKDRKGKKITNPRYMKTEYGVSCTFNAKCDCGATATAHGEGWVQASAMEENS